MAIIPAALCALGVYAAYQVLRWCCEDKAQDKSKRDQNKVQKDTVHAQQLRVLQRDIYRDFFNNGKVRSREPILKQSPLRYEARSSCFTREDLAVKKRTVVPAAKISSVPKHMLDLHNLFLDEAMREVRSFLKSKEEAFIRGGCDRADRFIHIITGQGNHSSVKGVPVIKPKVEDYLKRKEFCYRFVNPGMIQVDLMIKRQYL
ncbi:nedd4-binding protein 2 [Plakobranchus ocellatus]|uniref:Nedd4-binding protein 2 n=1 Tax=Plakobranchus ocellatus TaxID=259542 RepID=A0AAV4B5I6_9GAST|nr:nedd4-binding protein 2 [Plakobranchus ocellatus]